MIDAATLGTDERQGEIVSLPIRLSLPDLLPQPPATARLGTQAADPEPFQAFGWDTVFAIRVSDANAAIAASKAWPASFSLSSGGIVIAGSFGQWAIGRGGGGENICFAVPITQGSLQVGGKTAPMDGAVATVELKLDRIPQAGATLTSGPNNLVVRTTPVTATVGDSPVPPAVVTGWTFPPGKDPGPMARALMTGALGDWLSANLSAFTQIFAVVDLNRQADVGAFQWLAPTYTGYAYVDGSDDESSTLGILSAVDNDPAGALLGELSTAAIPPGQRAGFTISSAAMLRNMLLPSLANAFPGSTAANFAMSADGSSIVNVGTFGTPSVEHGGITYYPQVQSLSISVAGSELQVYMETSTDISPGIVAWVKNTAYLGIGLDTSSGTPKLAWSTSRPPVTEHWTDVATWVKITEAIIEIIAIVVIAILSVLTDGAAFVIAALIVSLVLGFAAATPELIASVAGNAVGNAVPSVAGLVLDATAPVAWSGSAAFALTEAVLNGGLQMGGDPFPAGFAGWRQTALAA